MTRISRWSESSFDIGALRRLALDGGLSVEQEARALLTYSISAARVRNDAAGNARLEKRGGTAGRVRRDDVAAAAILAAGAAAREPAIPMLRVVSV